MRRLWNGLMFFERLQTCLSARWCVYFCSGSSALCHHDIHI